MLRHLLIAVSTRERAALLNRKDNFGYAPVHWAATGGDGEASSYNDSASGNVAVLEQLLKFDELDVNARTSSGSTPLHYLCQKNASSPEVLARLTRAMLARGADPLARTNRNESFIHLTCARGRDDGACAAILSVALDDPRVRAGDLVNTQTARGDSVLHLCVYMKRRHLIVPLLRAGANPSLRTRKEAFTPRALALREKDAEAVAAFDAFAGGESYAFSPFANSILDRIPLRWWLMLGREVGMPVLGATCRRLASICGRSIGSMRVLPAIPTSRELSVLLRRDGHMAVQKATVVAFESVTKLVLDCGEIVNQSHLHEVVRYMPYLARLDVIGCAALTPSSLAPLADLSASLVSLDVSHCPQLVCDAGLQAISSLPLVHLRTLRIGGAAGLTATGMAALRSSTSLTRLRVLDLRYSQVHDDVLEVLPVVELESLVLRGCHSLTADGLTALFTRTTGSSITHLDLDATRTDDATIRAVVSTLSHLRTLSLRCCHALTRQALAAFTDVPLPELRSLAFDSSASLRPRDMSVFRRHAPQNVIISDLYC
jgi:hypothetical protein